MAHLQSELEENEKLMTDLTEQLKKVEDEAGEIMKACQEAEVSADHSLYPGFFYASVFLKTFPCFLLRYLGFLVSWD